MLYKGKILLAKPSSQNDLFSRSAVFIVEHNEEGAFGLILNKKNRIFSAGISDFLKKEVEIFDGGPVEKEKIFFIIKGKPITNDFLILNDDYYLTNNLNLILKIPHIHNEMKIFSGYSGWDAGQLENEIKNGFWYITDAPDFEEMIAAKDSLFWKKTLQNLGGECLIWANAPENIYMN